MKYEFKLDKEQAQRFEKWATEQAKKGRSRDFSGFRFQFVFGPTGCGDNIHVIDTHTHDEIVLSKDDDGEFIYNEDGSKNGW